MKDGYWNYRVLNDDSGFFLAECHFDLNDEGKIDGCVKIDGFSDYDTYDECVSAVFMALQDITKGRYVEFSTFVK
ncbi:MAG: hypothetical protein M0R03_15925 [Novosphingobium sp.]|nr:hypothetical protein [Novosphingobium sp.]